MRTRQQRWAEQAYRIVAARQADGVSEEYGRTCRSFPALVHSSGLCQAIAFVESKAPARRDLQLYLADLASMLGMQREALAKASREAKVPLYERLTLDAIEAASWLKRYAEALLEKPAVSETQQTGGVQHGSL